MAHNFKVGDRVRCISDQGWSGITKGEIYTVERVVADCIGVNGQIPAYSHRFELVERSGQPPKPSRIDQELAAAEAKVVALRAKAAARQKAAEDRAKKLAEAKAEREKRLKGLSKAGRRAVEMLSKDAGSFGCQRASVIALASALTGDDLAAALG